MHIQDCVVIITGGASGMGAATATLLNKQGAKIALLDTNKEAAEKIAHNVNGIAVACDVTQTDSVSQAISEVKKQLGPIRVLVNCAGIVHGRRVVNKNGILPLDEFRKVIEVNLVGSFNVISQVAAEMIPLPTIGDSAERGVIINTASVAAFDGQVGQAAYSASKGGIVSLALPLAREFAQFGIRVMTIAPGLVDTPMFSKIPPEARASLENMVPFPKRLARPEEYAMLVQQIIENPMLNGEVIRLDGALRMI